jgi:hypothetical protein
METIVVNRDKGSPRGSMFGTYAKIKGEVTEEKLAKAKELVIEDVCRMIREVANESEDFFIVKNSPSFAEDEYITVGHKFLLPTVEDFDGFSLMGDPIIVE